MRWLLFLSRLAFICGLFFVVSLSLQLRWTSGWIEEQSMVSTIVTIGVFMGLIVVPATNICYLIIRIMKKKSGVPAWLVIANISFLVLMLYYIFYLNDPYYHQA